MAGGERPRPTAPHHQSPRPRAALPARVPQATARLRGGASRRCQPPQRGLRLAGAGWWAGPRVGAGRRSAVALPGAEPLGVAEEEGRWKEECQRLNRVTGKRTGCSGNSDCGPPCLILARAKGSSWYTFLLPKLVNHVPTFCFLLAGDNCTENVNVFLDFLLWRRRSPRRFLQLCEQRTDCKIGNHYGNDPKQAITNF